MEQVHLQKAMRIYYFLLKEGELTFDNNKELYLDYSDSEVRDVLDVLSSESDVKIEKYNQVIYLIPNEENITLGINDMTMQKVLSYDARKIDFYVAQYIIVMIINVFFSGKGSYVKSRDFIRIHDLEEVITSRLDFARSKKTIEKEQKEAAFNITHMYEHWSSMQLDEDGKRKTKFGYIRSVAGFLAKHNLVIFDAVEDDIRPTIKFTNLMTYHFLDSNRLEMIKELLDCE